MTLHRLAPALVALALCTFPARPDTVELSNGDRLHGTIQRLQDGTLTLHSELLGVLRIDWTDVSAVGSDSSFAMLTADGGLLEGRVAREGDETVVSTADGPAATVPSASVVRLVPSKAKRGPGRLLRSSDGAVDLGYSVARGNQNQTQSSMGARLAYRTARYEVSTRLDSLFARQDGSRSQSRHALNLRVDRFLDARVFSYGLTGFERNERASLDLRTQLGGGVGWRLRRTRSNRLALVGGFAYVHERSRGVPDRATGEGSAGLEWNAALFGEVEWETDLTLHPDLVDRGRYRLQFDSILRIPVAGRFTYSLRLFDRYDSRPAAAVQRNDYGIVSGLGITF